MSESLEGVGGGAFLRLDMTDRSFEGVRIVTGMTMLSGLAQSRLHDIISV